jgi:hypothetical protein
MVAEAGRPPSASADRPPLSIDELARVLGGYCWVEREIFAVVGRWVEDETDARARIFFDEQSQQHAWHSTLFADRIPVLDRLDHDALCAAPGEPAIRMLGRVADAKGTLIRLAGLGRALLPRLVSGYSTHLTRCVPVADSAVARALGLVVRDDLEAWQTAEALLEEHLIDDSAVLEVHSHLGSVESCVAGVGPGLAPWPAA